MKRAGLIIFLSSLAITLALLLGYWALSHIGMTHSIVVDGITRRLQPKSVTPPARDAFWLPIYATTATLVELSPGVGQARVLGKQWATRASARKSLGVRSDGNFRGKQRRTLYARNSSNLFGESVLRYSVDANVAFYGDDIVISFVTAGGGHVGYRVEGEVVGNVTPTHCTLKVTESVHGFTTDYFLDLSYSERHVDCQFRGA